MIGLGSAASSGWTLTVDSHRATVEPLALTVQPQRLTRANLDALVDLLETATPPDAAGVVTAAPALDVEIGDALAALPTPAATPPPGPRDGPTDTATVRINVLGPITVEGLPLDVGTHLSRRSTELLVYLALRGRATGPELDEALWHGHRIDNQTRNSLVYRTRQRVGADVLPVVGPDGIYRLGPSVTCDWSEFQTRAHQGLTAGPEGVEALQAALALVRDRPLLGVPDSDYTWAEYDIQHMISAIADAAHVLALLRVKTGSHREAMQAAARGLLADAASSVLADDLIAAAEASESRDEIDRLRRRLRSTLSELDPELV